MNIKKKVLSVSCSLIIVLNLVLGFAAYGAVETKPEFRAAWIATVYNIDWPSREGLSQGQQKLELVNMMDEMKSMNLNAAILQVRSLGDAIYPSSFSPWSEILTGTQGVSPGYDPLQFAVDQAHLRNMELHAWFNPFRISASSGFNLQQYMDKLPASSPLKGHSDWIVNYGGYICLNPGIPEARNYVLDTIMEVVKNYNIDGVHLDDYFYPYPVSGLDFPDDAQFAQYGSGYSAKADWRRSNINLFISELNRRIKSVKSSVKLGISPFGIWRNKSAQVPEGSNTNGLSSYDSLYQDSVKWVNEHWIDYIAPQIYWNMGYSKADYSTLVAWWSNIVQSKNVQLYIGQAAYKVGDSSQGTAWMNPDEIINQINYARQFDAVKGSIFFSARDLIANPLGIKDKLKTGVYAYPVQIPSMSWLSTNGGTTSTDYSVSIDKTPPQRTYSDIKITAGIPSGADTLYKFSVYDGNSWTVLQDYSGTNSCSWLPARTGDYRLRVEFKDRNGSSSTAPVVREMDYSIRGANRVFLDPAHGGSDTGYVGASGIKEEDVALAVSKQLKELLKNYGIEVITSRDQDTALTDSQRVLSANDSYSQIFISIHADSSADASLNGITTLYYPGSNDGQRLAGLLQQQAAGTAGAASIGIQTSTAQVLNETNMPGVLLNTGYLSNSTEEAKLGTAEYQRKLAVGMEEAVLKYFGILKEDINKDGIVDINDAAVLSRYTEADAGQGTWQSAVDINGDRRIDILDLTSISKKIR